jgi:ubiquinone/menaquinone biosynthesis C-methylase UbiE
MAKSRNLMFGQLARYYDLVYSGKDYRTEVLRLQSLARRWGRSGGRLWLDVACGTGRHLEILRRSYSVSGVDRSDEMLRVARRRLPGVRLRSGDMRTFRLKQRFDVVTCLFSAIGHLASQRDLQLAFANFARHLKPGGVVMVEPWIDPSRFSPGHVHMVTFSDPSVMIARISFSSRKGNHSRVHYHYLIAEKGRGIRHFDEIDVGLLASRHDLLTAMRGAGLRARFLEKGFTAGRGLLVGTKSSSPEY